MRDRHVITLVAALLLAPCAVADVLHLTDGRKLDGLLISKTERSVEFMRPHGTVTFAAARVVKVETTPTPLRDYVERRDALKAGDAEARLELARWCRAKKLRSAEKKLLREVIEIDDTKVEAHRRLGHVEVDGQWMSKAAARRARGLVRRGGKWITAIEAKRLDSRRAAAARTRILQSRINSLAARLASRSSKRRETAYDDLVKLAKKEKIAGLADGARVLRDHWNRYWSLTTVELRLQYAKVTGMPTVPVSLGTGTPVRIQLPRTRHVGVGTTVVVPSSR